MSRDPRSWILHDRSDPGPVKQWANCDIMTTSLHVCDVISRVSIGYKFWGKGMFGAFGQTSQASKIKIQEQDPKIKNPRPKII